MEKVSASVQSWVGQHKLATAGNSNIQSPSSWLVVLLGRGVARGGGGGAPVLLLQQGEAGGGGERHGARLLLAAAAGHRRGRPGERALELLSPHPARRIAALPPGDRSERDDDDEDDDDQISA